jgi:hypothetical protein
LVDNSYLIFELKEQKDGEKLELITPTSQIKTRLYSRETSGVLLFDGSTQQGQVRKMKLASPKGKNPDWVLPLATKMTVNHVAVIKRLFKNHNQNVEIKDEDGIRQTIEGADIYYFLFIDEEKKSKGGAAQANLQQAPVKNFDKY